MAVTIPNKYLLGIFLLQSDLQLLHMLIEPLKALLFGRLLLLLRDKTRLGCEYCVLRNKLNSMVQMTAI